MADWRQPDDAMLSLLRDREVLGRIVAEVAGETVASANAAEKFKTLKRIVTEALTSPAIRSPMTRESTVSVAEHLRRPLPERERNSLIAVNMRDMRRRAVEAFGTRGKATAILSRDREFIFGDGFYHNLNTPSMAPHLARILAPLTPRLAVLYAIPMQYTPEPRLSSLVIGNDEVDSLNQVVQIYARERVFYGKDRPELIDEYRARQHRHFTTSRNIVENIVHDMPGVPARNTALDFLEDIFRATEASVRMAPSGKG